MSDRQRCWCGAFASEWSASRGIHCSACGDEIHPVELRDNGYAWDGHTGRWVR